MITFHLLAAGYAALVSYGGAWRGEAPDTRLLDYPLWTAGTVALLVATVVTARWLVAIPAPRAATDRPPAR